MEGVKEWLVSNLKKNPIIIEAGCCDGTDTIKLAETWPEATIYAFEPIPALFEKALKRLKPYKNVQCIPFALSSKNGLIQMNVSTRNGEVFGSSSILEPKEHLDMHPEIKFENKLFVAMMTLHLFCFEQGIANVDLLYLDMQGHEMEVLKSPMLANVKSIYTEVSLIETYKGVPHYSQVRSHLEDNGFHVVHEDLPWKDMGNVLFSR